MRGRRGLGIVGVFMGLVILMEGGCADGGTRVSQQEGVGAGTWERQSVATEASLPAPTPEHTPQPTPSQEEAMNQITISVNGQEFPTVLENNAAVKALLEKLEEGPLALSMGEYGGFEKVGGLGFSLPASDTQITTQPGDMVLYQSNQLVVFTGSNTWSYTKLGRVEDPTALIDALGPGDVRLLLSISAG